MAKNPASLSTSYRSAWRHERAVIAATGRHRPDDPALTEHRERLRAAKAALDIAQIVESAPPLTVEQRNVLAFTLLGGAQR